MRYIKAVKDNRIIIYRRIGKQWEMRINWDGERKFYIRNIKIVLDNLLKNGFKISFY